MPLDRLFHFKEAQERWNEAWERRRLFTPELPSSRPPFVIVLPPPNVTGVLHMGHVLGDSVQDLLIRWKRMKGFNTLYVPGTDHAGIATQKVVEVDLEKQGIRRAELTRERFLEQAWDWKERHHRHIVIQLKRLGCALDWTREAFTLDEARSRSVREAFVRLYKKGLIYRGHYIVNWCPACGTAISDEEVEHREKDAFLYWIRYPTEVGPHILVATTRPETMLGDTAVAVNPGDETKARFVGGTAVLPIVGRKLPIVADAAVDPEFGSGFVKVTPAHDPNDFEIGRRHGLPHVVVIDRNGRMAPEAGDPFVGLGRFDCRKRVLEALEAQNLLEKVEPHRHSLGHHDRCGTVIEPLLSEEWFVRMKPLAAPAIEVVERDEIEFYPPRWRNVYLSWMHDIRDWCISRELWWGHRIPVWYCPEGHETVAVEDPERCGTCRSKELRQDENVLDTWFSSWLWTFSPLGWPAKTRDLDAFHPTSVLVTGSEIIFFWVARMIIASLEFLGEIPFRHVFLTGMVRDTRGRKMSKSLGNSPEPLELIDKYGTDTLRFTLVMLSPPGRDVFFSEEKLEMGRNFGNKLWQASRMIMDAYERDGSGLFGKGRSGTDSFSKKWNGTFPKRLGFQPKLEWEDRWILSALNGCIADVDDRLSSWRLNDAASRLYEFVWGEFCDWYLELSKIRLHGDGDKRTVLAVLLFTLAHAVKMLHPFVPYITEELWDRMPMTDGILLESVYPEPISEFADAEIDSKMQLFKALVTAARNIPAEYRLDRSAAITVRIKTPESGISLVAELAEGIQRLARAKTLEYGPHIRKEKGSASSPIGEYEVIIPLAGAADIQVEIERLEKEKLKIEEELSLVDKKLSNKNFVKKAKREVVERERSKRSKLKTELDKIMESIHLISGDA